jgi:integrase
VSVTKKCAASGCKQHDHRCDDTWHAEFMVTRVRYYIAVDDYAIARGATGHVVTKKAALAWEAQMRIDVKQGRDPRLPPTPTGDVVVTVAEAAATYDAAELKTPKDGGKLKHVAGPKSDLRHIIGFFGDRAITALEEESVVAEFETALRRGWRPPDVHGTPQPELPHGRQLRAVNGIMGRLRHFLRWAMAQKPRLLQRSPFHKYGIVVRASDETQRTRRLYDGELDALREACLLMQADDGKHAGVGVEMARRLEGLYALGVRGSELNRVRTTDIDWTHCVVAVYKGKSKKPRLVPFEPGGPLDQGLQPRRFLKPPHNFVFGNEEGRRVRWYRAWVTMVLVAYGKVRLDAAGHVWRRGGNTHTRVVASHRRRAERDQKAMRGIGLQVRDLRRERASLWWESKKFDVRDIQILLGHATLVMTQRYLQLKEGDDLSARMATAFGWKVEDRPVQSRPAPKGLIKLRKDYGNRGGAATGTAAERVG